MYRRVVITRNQYELVKGRVRTYPFQKVLVLLVLSRVGDVTTMYQNITFRDVVDGNTSMSSVRIADRDEAYLCVCLGEWSSCVIES